MIHNYTNEKVKGKKLLPTIERKNVLKGIFWIKQAWNDLKCNTIVKCFKKCGFVNNTAENLAEELFGTTVGELHEINVTNEESDDEDGNNKMDFNLVAKKVLNDSMS